MKQRARWAMLSFAFFATVINYLDRQALSVAAPVLKRDFHLSASGYAHIVFLFLLAYTLMNGVSGFLIDRLGTKLGYGMAVAWWSTSAILHAFAQGPFSLGLFRFLLGLGEAGNWPGAVRVVAEWFEPEERGVASGFFNSGSAMGAIIAPPLIAWLLIVHGWRSAFAGVGMVGFIWLLFWIVLYRSPVQKVSITASEPMTYRMILRSRFLWVFLLAKVFFDPVWYFYTFWYPEYLHASRHFTIASIGKLAWIPFFVAGLGSVLGGQSSGVLLRRGLSYDSARKLPVAAGACMMMCAIPAVLTQSTMLSIGFVSIAMAGYTVGLANMLAMPADVLPSDKVAFAYGIASMGSGLGGMLFTLLTGVLVDRYSYTPVFLFFGTIPVISVVILWFGYKTVALRNNAKCA